MNAAEPNQRWPGPCEDGAQGRGFDLVWVGDVS